ncbi:MAG TPA: septum formation initiator family protein [Syntrophales bacterium]|nr:septum formation initiator family protein [Syntrophales bacterium]HOX94572.1 septum formation initiator family protein [Syntrophales bacterium]HPI57681.1 septum formation initiator family protein [Syntrophales bacterium]HPN23914.1 septum formation initiator family protein [Syntrophales bacterium]HQM28192.1 septum formation initiator family protein [Syntrophales bacterium]
MKLGRRVIMIILLVMGFLILFGKKGLIDNYKVQQMVKELSVTNERMLKENNKLKQEILLLRKDTKYIERLARDELGMVKKGDIVYRMSDETKP